MANRLSKNALMGIGCVVMLSTLLVHAAPAADRILTLYTARVMSQAYPWIAQDAGLFRKYDLDIPLVFVTPGAPAVAAILSGDSEVAVIGAASITRPVVQGNKDPVFIGGIKSLLTHSIIAKTDIKRAEQLKGKKSGSPASAAIPTISPCRLSVISISTSGKSVSFRRAERRKPWPRW